MTVKQFARVKRAEAARARAVAARAAHVRNLPWSRIAQEVGYYDQAHLISDFRSIVGRTPRQRASRRSSDRVVLADTRVATKERHPAYRASMLSGTAPEYSTGEVLVASAYRRFLLDVSESSVDLEDITHAHESMPAAVGGPEVWSRLLMDRGGIASPFRHGQYSPLASRQLMPCGPGFRCLPTQC